MSTLEQELIEDAKAAGFYVNDNSITVFEPQYYSVNNSDISKKLTNFAQLVTARHLSKSHEDLLKIHTVIMGIADVEPVNDSDSYTVKQVKIMAQRLNKIEGVLNNG